MVADDIAKQLTSMVGQLKTRYDAKLAPVLDRVCALIESAIDDNFDAHGRWDGNESQINIFSGGSQKWIPLAESTKRDYARFGYELEPTLYRTGTLRNSIEARRYGDTSIVVGSNLEYAAAHNFGYNFLPARPFITLTEEDLQLILKEFTSLFS